MLRKSRFMKALIFVMMSAMLISMLTVSAFAAVEISDEHLAILQQEIKVTDDKIDYGKLKSLRGYFSLDPDHDKEKSPLFTVGETPLYLAKGKEPDTVTSQIKLACNQMNMSPDDITQDMGVGADITSAQDMLSGFVPILNLIIGLLATLITIGMTIYSALDIAYLAFPVFRNKCEEVKASGSSTTAGRLGTTTSANGETKLRFVSDDAQIAAREGSVDSGKGPWGIYFKRRVVSYILLAIIMFILLTDNISLITKIAINLVSGIMDVLISLGG